MRRHLMDVREVELPQGTLLDVGRMPGLEWDVAVAETGPTNTRAALITQPTVEYFDAEAVFFVGVAGALKDSVSLGDVVVASKVYGYHGGRESTDGFHARPDSWEPTHPMEQLVRSACRNEPWAFLDGDATPPRVHFEPIASGDVLVGSRDSETARRIRNHYNDAVAVDMESHGITQAVKMHRTVRALSIRGISDPAGPSKAACDATGSQETASRHAAAFARRVLRDLRPTRPTARGHVQRPPVLVVSAPDHGGDSGTWASRPVVEVDGQEYLLYQGPEGLPLESRDGDVMRRQAVARLLSDQESRGSYAWLRQVEWLRPLPGPRGFDPLVLLDQEAAMCRTFHGPDVVQLNRQGNTATLALSWPADPISGRPSETLHDLLPDPPAPAGPLRLWSIVKGLSEVAEVLERLGSGNLSHRALRPTSIIMNRRRTMLRDFGLAAVPPRPGENPGPYQAPEQRFRSHFRPGTATDVYQLGAILYRALAGRSPDAGAYGMPPSALPHCTPDSLVQAVTVALRQDPHERPGIRTFRVALLSAARELSSVPPPAP